MSISLLRRELKSSTANECWRVTFVPEFTV